MVCVDSTVLGPALGGRQIKSYPSWHDGVEDAVRLSAAMTEKAALADLDHGGGKTVALPDHRGPANNQLDADSTAELLPTRGIIWAPDTIASASASGIVAATARELQHLSNTETDRLLVGIGDRLADLLDETRQHDRPPLHVARQHAQRRLQHVDRA